MKPGTKFKLQCDIDAQGKARISAFSGMHPLIFLADPRGGYMAFNPARTAECVSDVVNPPAPPERILLEEVIPPIWQEGDYVVANEGEKSPCLPNYAGFLPPFFTENGLRVFRRVKT
jgi:hypothetical protein